MPNEQLEYEKILNKMRAELDLEQWEQVSCETKLRRQYSKTKGMTKELMNQLIIKIASMNITYRMYKREGHFCKNLPQGVLTCSIHSCERKPKLLVDYIQEKGDSRILFILALCNKHSDEYKIDNNIIYNSIEKYAKTHKQDTYNI